MRNQNLIMLSHFGYLSVPNSDVLSKYMLVGGSYPVMSSMLWCTYQEQTRWQQTRTLLPVGLGCRVILPSSLHTFSGRGPAWSHTPLSSSFWQRTYHLQKPPHLVRNMQNSSEIENYSITTHSLAH